MVHVFLTLHRSSHLVTTDIIAQRLLQQCWSYHVFTFCPFVHPSVRLSLLAQYHVNVVREFSQIYSFGTLGSKGEPIRFQGQKVKVMIGPNIGQNLFYYDDSLN